MSLLSVKHLSQGYGDKSLYENASFELVKGEHIGVVGQNGVGKSTFLQILTGEVVPDSGEIRWQRGIRVGHLDQYARTDDGLSIETYLKTAYAALYELEAKMTALYEKSAETGDESLLSRASSIQERLLEADFYAIDSEIGKVAAGLGLTAIGLDRPLGELSGGQRAKVILAKLLLEKADVLLLDEPTNFLDKEHVAWLADYLVTLESAFIVVSHNFEFLEKIATGVCDIEFGTIKKYSGGFSEFLKQKSLLREDYIRRYHAQQKEIERTEEFIRRNIAGVNTKMAQGRRKQLARMEKLAPPSFAEKPNFRFKEAKLLAQDALSVAGLEVGYYYPLLPKIGFEVKSGQTLVVTGFNGIGKSTLLKTLVGEIPAISGGFTFTPQVVLGYYEQDLNWENPRATPMNIIYERYPKMSPKELRSALARFGVKADHAIQPIETLSGGEQSKVKLCRLALAPCNFLILDEPTNHLDAETKEVLRAALVDFSGSVILVSHEEKFYKDFADRVLDIGQ
ncbi:ATP-binding cassette domain-containing protein [Oscillospiraceae bacterium OttesenSCG-928-G22]|nr:ATP-binding cassette domain-containing protein [Oscillospiraceae bacterium OttesenSCG-928-G22]